MVRAALPLRSATPSLALGASLLSVLIAAPPAPAAAPELGPEIQINAVTDRRECCAAVTERGGDGFVAVWPSLQIETTELRARLLDVDGVPRGAELRVDDGSDSTRPEQPRVDAAADAAFVVVWRDRTPGSMSSELRGRRFDAAGAAVGGDLPLVAPGTGPYDRESPDVAVFDDGAGFVVAWEQHTDGARAQRFDAAGAPVGAEIEVTAARVDGVRVAAGEDGFSVAWATPFVPYSVGLKRFERDGSALAAELVVDGATSDWRGWPDVAALPAGRFVVVWASYEFQGAPDAYGFGVRGRVIEPPGAASRPAIQLNSHTTGYQSRPQVQGAADGQFVVTWSESDRPPSYWFIPDDRVRARVFSPAGTPVGGDLELADETSGRYSRPTVAGGGPGHFLVVWSTEEALEADPEPPAILVRTLDVPALLSRHDFERGDLDDWDEVVVP